MKRERGRSGGAQVRAPARDAACLQESSGAALQAEERLRQRERSLARARDAFSGRERSCHLSVWPELVLPQEAPLGLALFCTVAEAHAGGLQQGA